MCALTFVVSVTVRTPYRRAEGQTLTLRFCMLQAAFEDVEFCVRAVKGGVHICYEPDAVVRHRYDCTALGLFRCSGPVPRTSSHGNRPGPVVMTLDCPVSLPPTSRF